MSLFINDRHTATSTHTVLRCSSEGERGITSLSNLHFMMTYISHIISMKWCIKFLWTVPGKMYVGGPKINRTGFGERFLIVVECSPAR